MIKLITDRDTLSLRSTVLRNGAPEVECIFPTDDEGFHLGKFVKEKLVCIATFFPEDYPDQGLGGYRLRGMATDPDFAGKGYGAQIINFAIDKLIAENASYIWCNARSSAVGFYKKQGFELISDEFEVPGIGMHFNMMYNLNRI